MNTATKTTVVTLCLALGLSTLGCGKLNPKTEEHIQSALEAKREEFQKCYEKALEENREIEGSMKLAIDFAPKAQKPEEVAVKGTKIANEGMQKCVTKAAKKIEIAEPAGVYVNGLYTVDFDLEK